MRAAGPSGGPPGASWCKQLLKDGFFEVGLVVEQQSHRDVAILVDLNAGHIARLGEIGDGADRALVAFERVDPDLSLVAQQSDAPAPGTKGTDRGQRQNTGAKRNDRAV